MMGSLLSEGVVDCDESDRSMAWLSPVSVERRTWSDMVNDAVCDFVKKNCKYEKSGVKTTATRYSNEIELRPLGHVDVDPSDGRSV